MRLLHHYISIGWPKSKQKVPDKVKEYFNYSSELTVIDGLIFKNNKLVVPPKYKKRDVKINTL